jgi:hypothetical protein
MTQLLEVRQLDAAIFILEDLKDSLPRPTVSPGAKAKVLAKAIDQLDDLRDLLSMPRVGRQPVTNEPARFTHNLLTLFGALALATCSVQVGILHGRANCPAPNVARMGP